MLPFQQTWPRSQDPKIQQCAVSVQTDIGSIEPGFRYIRPPLKLPMRRHCLPVLRSSLQPLQTIHLATTAKHITIQTLHFILEHYFPSPTLILPDRTLELLFYSIDLSISPAQLPEHRRNKPTGPFFVFHHHDVNLFGDWQILFDTKHIIQSQSLPLLLFFL